MNEVLGRHGLTVVPDRAGADGVRQPHRVQVQRDLRDEVRLVAEVRHRHGPRMTGNSIHCDHAALHGLSRRLRQSGFCSAAKTQRAASLHLRAGRVADACGRRCRKTQHDGKYHRRDGPETTSEHVPSVVFAVLRRAVGRRKFHPTSRFGDVPVMRREVWETGGSISVSHLYGLLVRRGFRSIQPRAVPASPLDMVASLDRASASARTAPGVACRRRRESPSSSSRRSASGAPFPPARRQRGTPPADGVDASRTPT